jgi:hypothetical protein
MLGGSRCLFDQLERELRIPLAEAQEKENFHMSFIKFRLLVGWIIIREAWGTVLWLAVLFGVLVSAIWSLTSTMIPVNYPTLFKLFVFSVALNCWMYLIGVCYPKSKERVFWWLELGMEPMLYPRNKKEQELVETSVFSMLFYECQDLVVMFEKQEKLARELHCTKFDCSLEQKLKKHRRLTRDYARQSIEVEEFKKKLERKWEIVTDKDYFGFKTPAHVGVIDAVCSSLTECIQLIRNIRNIRMRV